MWRTLDGLRAPRDAGSRGFFAGGYRRSSRAHPRPEEKIMAYSKRALIVAAAATAAAALTACGQTGAPATGSGGKAANQWEVPGDFALGSPDAKVVIIEYASIMCPHCAHFHRDVVPALKANYIDKGLVRYVFRDFPTPPMEIATAGHLMARCAGPAKYHDVIAALMGQQENIIRAAQGPTGVRQALVQIAASAGMSEQQFDACLKDQAQLDAIAKTVQDGQQKYNITGTPTVIINGEVIKDPKVVTAAGISELIDARLKAAG
jgi:protein-disulfide isomerase